MAFTVPSFLSWLRLLFITFSFLNWLFVLQNASFNWLHLLRRSLAVFGRVNTASANFYWTLLWLTFVQFVYWSTLRHELLVLERFLWTKSRYLVLLKNSWILALSGSTFKGVPLLLIIIGSATFSLTHHLDRWSGNTSHPARSGNCLLDWVILLPSLI